MSKRDRECISTYSKFHYKVCNHCVKGRETATLYASDILCSSGACYNYSSVNVSLKFKRPLAELPAASLV